MLALGVGITITFVILYLKNSNQEELLDEKGVTTSAWVINLDYKKTSKKSTPNFYMEVAFFSDTTQKLPILKDTSANLNAGPVDAILEKMKINSAPQGDYITSSIEISQSSYQNYKINDVVKIVYLKEDPKIIRLIGKQKQ